MTTRARTRTTTAQAAPVPVQPIGNHKGRPLYRSQEAPADLATQTQLKSRRLKLADGQKPAAYVRISRPHPGAGDVPLYRPEEAVKMRPLSARQQREIIARRTCILCSTLHGAPLWERSLDGHPWLPHRGPVCEDCNRGREERWRRTCARCTTVFQDGENLSYAGRLCDSCGDIRRRGEDVVSRLVRRHCPDCTGQTASHEELAAADAADDFGRAYGFPRTCEPCQAEQRRRAEEALRTAERERWDELGPVREWARDIVARPDLYAVLDTETTGFGADARAVEIGVTTGDGTVLLDTLVHPGVPIPDEASAIHGIHDEDVRDAPSFGDVLPRLTEALHGRRVVIYHRTFDRGLIACELDRHHRQHTPTDAPDDEPHPATAEWMDAQEWSRCAMLAYAVHKGEWSSYWGGWAWPRLHGGHRALSDCRAVVKILREMAERPDPF